MSKEHLATYLNDHLAGSNFAVEVLDHLAAEAPDMQTSLAALKKDIVEDRKQLQLLMTRLTIPESRVRKAGGWIAEQVAEAKLGVDDDPSGPFRRLERLEALEVGVYGKVALWKAMSVTLGSTTQGEGIDFERLVQRAEEQRGRVETLRLQAARAALAFP